MKALHKILLTIAAAATLAGCASVPDNAGQDPSDPWEKLNRNTFAFNQKVDTYLIRPAAKGYEFVVPEYARERIGNIYGNLNEPANVLNNALQGKGEGALVSLFRLMINTTLGLGGMYDVAGTAANQPARREDFGQTLAVWGVGNGPYFVIPFLVVVLSLVIALRLTGNEAGSALICLCALIPYYLIIYMCRHKLDRTFVFTLETVA